MISVIIPTYNAIQHIDKLIAKLNEQIIDDDKEIIIIDSSSSDGTVEFCLNLPDIKFISIDKKDFDHGGTRNKAAMVAKGGILVFITQDALPFDNFFLKKLIKPLQDSSIAATYGRQVARPDATIIEKLTREFNYPNKSITKTKKDIPKLGIKTFYLTNVCSAYKRNDFDQVGRFPETTILNEDMLIAFKLIMADMKVSYACDAMVYHSHNYGCWQQFRRNFDIGVSLRMQNEVMEYSRAESEGIKFVRFMMRRLFANHKYAEMIVFATQTAFKFSGFKAGKCYRKLPKRLRILCSMNRNFWINCDGIKGG